MTPSTNPARDGWKLLPCPFCGSKNIDPEGWVSTDRKGPACDDCSGSADTVELWNSRPLASAPAPASGVDAVAAIEAIGKWHMEQEPNTGAMSESLARDLMQRWHQQGRAVQQCQHILRSLSPAATSGSEAGGERHWDDLAVDRFAYAMKAKLAKKRAEGYGGWDRKIHMPGLDGRGFYYECPNSLLSRLLREHVEKGDPVDVANFCMMIHQRGERIG